MEEQFPSFMFIVAFLVFVLLLLRTRWKLKSTPKQPPGPWKLPLIGNMHQLVGSSPHHRLTDLAKKYGPIMRLQHGEVTNIIISSPEAAKEIMKTHDTIFSERPFVRAACVIGYNRNDLIFAPYGEYWRQLRKMCTLELLTAKRVQSFRSIREEEVSKLIKSIASFAGSPINFSSMIYALTFSIASRATLGKIYKWHGEFLPVVKEMMEAGGSFYLADFYPSIKLLYEISGMKAKLERLHREGDKILEIIIKEHRAVKAPKNNAEIEEDDLVDVLLQLQEQSNSLTNDNIKAVILDIFTAGGDTSSTTVEWAMSEMLKNPRVMKKAQAEVRQLFGTRPYVDEAGLNELNYLKLVIKETLRLHPPAAVIPRECRENCVINGYDFPAKSRVLVNLWAIGRDPNYWIEAERFYPERFLDSSVDYKGANYEFLPFGAGRRMCPGILFAIANIELLLAQLLFHFDWKLPDGLKTENLDMAEVFGGTVKRKNDLHLIPIPGLLSPFSLS